MNLKRATRVFLLDLSQNLGRPIFWILILILGLTSWGLSQGNVTIQSGNSAVGGTKAWITSEFANAKMLSMVIFLFYSFFIAVVAGMAIMQDDDLKVGEVLHATPLRPNEYYWGKLSAVVVSFLAVLTLHLLSAMFFNHVVPNPKAVEVRGPFALIHYLRPALILGLPSMLFVTGTTFAIGERTRKPILVFVLPVALLLLCGFFLWDWTPSWLDPRLNRVLMLLDPAGVRWLSETWLKVDRGVEFYNKAPMQFDPLFLLSRLGFVLFGLLAAALSQRHFSATLRGSGGERRVRRPRGEGATEAAALPATDRPLAGLNMRARVPGFLNAVRTVLVFELRELRSQPGLFLFIPIILIQTLGTSLVGTGAFDTPILVTPGTLAVRTMNTLTLLICLLSLFYMVESLRRERSTGIAPLYFATPTGTGSILFGKVLANCVVGLCVALATMLAGLIAIVVEHKVGLSLMPFLVVWGTCLIPTFLLWNAFVMVLYAATNNRYTTYAVALGALSLTGYLQAVSKMNWVGNWDLWGVLRWSDMGLLPLNGVALFWNRLFALGLTVFFVALTVRIFPRHDRDAVRVLHRLEPARLGRSILRLLPYAVVPVVAASVLWVQVNQGFQGKAEEKKEKDYWKQNLATWKDAPAPGITHADLNLELTPAKRFFHMDGAYTLINRTTAPLRQLPLTGGAHWEDIAWTMNGAEYKPEDRTHLFIFTPPAPLAPGDTVRIGFRYHGTFPQGTTKNGGTSEFILPSGVVLTSFTPSFVPVIGYMEDVGVTKENRYEPKVYADDFYKGITPPGEGSSVSFTTHIKVSAPAEYTINSVGTLVSDEVSGGRRTVVWDSDHPVRFFNVVAGRWKVREGDGTAVYYHPGHGYNVEEISQALDAARKYYSEWFAPFPWSRLKLSEFPALAFYAQGFPTNITFSEGIGFLTKSDPKTNTAFWVTAHESAHQWWGNIVTPGKGPGANLLAEGMAHFSTILLLDQVKGEKARIEFCKRIEEHYGNNRQVDSERPLVKIDDSRPGDETATYDKGGWVFWMLLNRMGREADLAGLRSFITTYREGPDYPVLQDFVESMRSFAPDSASYREFVNQWFFQVVVPEYRLSGAKRIQAGKEGGAEKEGVVGRSATAAPTSGAAGGRADVAGAWNVRVHVENIGTGRMPVDVAACAGDRFDKDGKPNASYHEARTHVTLGAGEKADLSIPCDFKPDCVLVDPDARVLQLRRSAAIVRF